MRYYAVNGAYFLPGLPSARNLIQILLLCLVKNSVQSINTMHRVYFCIKFYQTCTLSPTKHKTNIQP